MSTQIELIENPQSIDVVPESEQNEYTQASINETTLPHDNDDYRVFTRVTSEDQPRFKTQMDKPIQDQLETAQALPQINNNKALQ